LPVFPGVPAFVEFSWALSEGEILSACHMTFGGRVLAWLAGQGRVRRAYNIIITGWVAPPGKPPTGSWLPFVGRIKGQKSKGECYEPKALYSYYFAHGVHACFRLRISRNTCRHPPPGPCDCRTGPRDRPAGGYSHHPPDRSTGRIECTCTDKHRCCSPPVVRSGEGFGQGRHEDAFCAGWRFQHGQPGRTIR